MQKKNELLVEQIREIELHADKNLINNEQIVLINADLYKLVYRLYIHAYSILWNILIT